MRETGFINFVKASLKFKNKNVLTGIGDDCAVLRHTKHKHLLVTSDALCENTHFSRRYFLPAEIGMRAAAVNISDICAMGGVPLYAAVNIGFPAKEKQQYIDTLYTGLVRYLENYGVQLIGGDTVGSDRLFLSVTLIGEVEKQRIMERNGAKPGDVIFVTGFLGDSYAGFRVLSGKARKRVNGAEYLPVKRHLVPAPRFIEGRVLSASGLVTSCIDVSDGAVNDITRICEASKTGAELDAALLPVSYSAASIAAAKGENSTDYALYGGEDFELMFTIRPRDRNKFLIFAEKNNTPVFEIGRITGGKSVYIIKKGKRTRADYKKAWKHF